jgi:hypothetical protein
VPPTTANAQDCQVLCGRAARALQGRALKAQAPKCLAVCLTARAHAKVSGIPSSHAKYPLGSGAFSLRGYFAWSGI